MRDGLLGPSKTVAVRRGGWVSPKPCDGYTRLTRALPSRTTTSYASWGVPRLLQILFNDLVHLIRVVHVGIMAASRDFLQFSARKRFRNPFLNGKRCDAIVFAGNDQCGNRRLSDQRHPIHIAVVFHQL